MITRSLVAAAAFTVAAFCAPPASAMSLALQASDPEVTLIAGGCGPGAWRGPWGHCRNTPYYGPLPNGYYSTRPYNGCPPGYWRGPWGHCRNTPYHGRLPNGTWK